MKPGQFIDVVFNNEFLEWEPDGHQAVCEIIIADGDSLLVGVRYDNATCGEFDGVSSVLARPGPYGPELRELAASRGAFGIALTETVRDLSPGVRGPQAPGSSKAGASSAGSVLCESSASEVVRPPAVKASSNHSKALNRNSSAGES